jgi:hypothetical protein
MTTTTEMNYEDLASLYSDMYKEVHGFRPRGFYGNVSAEHLQSQIEWLAQESARQMAELEIIQTKNAADFEIRIGKTIAMGAGNRETALRWIHEAEGTNGDNDYLCYVLNLDYGYIK